MAAAPGPWWWRKWVKVGKSCRVLSSRQARGLQYQPWPPGGALGRAGPRGSCPWALEVGKVEKKTKSRPPGGPPRCPATRARLGALIPGHGTQGGGPLSLVLEKTAKKRQSAQSPGAPGQFPSPLRGAHGPGEGRPLPPGGMQGAWVIVPERGAPRSGSPWSLAVPGGSPLVKAKFF